MDADTRSLEWLFVMSGDPRTIPVIRARRFSIEYVYRVFTSFTPKDPVDKREDVIAPCYRVIKRPVGQALRLETPAIRLFYRGSENELSRYILWLRSVHLGGDVDDLVPVYVALQKSADAQSCITELYPKTELHFVGPGELEHYGLLAGRANSSEAFTLF